MSFFTRLATADGPADDVAGVGQPVGVEVDPSATPDAEIAALEAQRDVVLAEITRINKVGAALAVAVQTLAAVSAEEQALLDAERVEWISWAHDQEGRPTPEPKTAERADLARRRAVATDSLSAARNAEAAVAGRRSELQHALRRVDDAIYTEKVNAIAADASAANVKAHELAAELVGVSQAFEAARLALVRARAKHASNGNTAKGAAIAEAAAVVERLARPTLAGKATDLDAEVDRVLARLA